MNRVCTLCAIEKPEEAFSWNDGAHTKRRSSCKACAARKTKSYYHAHRDKVLSARDREIVAARVRVYRAAHPERVKETQRKSRPKARARERQRRKDNLVQYLWKSAKYRAQVKNVPFTIEASDIEVPAVCPVLGIPLYLGGRNSPNSPSLDRIVPALGYVAGNVHVISYRANSLKRDATTAEMVALAAYFSALDANGS